MSIKDLRLTNDDVLCGIADTAMKIEINDRKAARIILPPEIFHNLKASYPEVLDWRSTFNGRAAVYPSFVDPWTGTPGLLEKEPIAKLWGMDVEIAPQAKDIMIKSECYAPWYYSPIDTVIGEAPAAIEGLPRNRRGLTVPVERVNENTIRQVETISLYQIKLKILRRNSITPIVKKYRANPIFTTNIAELTALETLREMITEADYRKYVTQGFILVKGASGRTYQIFRQRRHIKVWLNGNLVEELCIQIKDDIKAPLTDRVIAFKTIVEVSESQLRNLSNVFNMKHTQPLIERRIAV